MFVNEEVRENRLRNHAAEAVKMVPSAPQDSLGGDIFSRFYGGQGADILRAMRALAGGSAIAPFKPKPA